MTDTAPSKLQQLRDLSVVVADTGDYDAIKRLKPVDCTTNPTLVKKALDLPVYADLIEEQLAWARAQGGGDALVDEVVDRLTIGVGARLAGLIPGRVSTEVDADQAYDTGATIAKSSGNKAWDDAVIRALQKTETLPRDIDGRVPSDLVIGFRPQD